MDTRDIELLRFYGLFPPAWRRVWEDAWSVTYARCMDKRQKITLRW